MLINWYRFSSPVSFYPLAGTGAHVFGVLAALFAGAGLFVALYAAPTDATQGDAYRIIYLHVPAAWMAMLLAGGIATWWVLVRRRARVRANSGAPPPSAGESTAAARALLDD